MIHLERFAYTPMGTFGRLKFDDNEFSCYTVERPWLNNEGRISCVPEGLYSLVWHNGPKFGKTVALVGGTVSEVPNGISKRSAILIHPANEMNDLQGCIGLGTSLGMVRNNWAVLNSVPTVRKFYEILELHPHELPNLNITQISGAI